MFDDQPMKGPNPPGNLPIGEPEDIFGAVDKTAGPVETDPIMSQPSALDRGALRPKQSEPRITVPPVLPAQGPETAGGRPDIYTVKEPVLARGIITFLAIIVVLAVLGVGGWWVYIKFVKQNIGIVPNNSQPVEEILLTEEPELTAEETSMNDVETGIPPNNDDAALTDVGAEVEDQQVLFGEPIDKDGDGLDDTKEIELGTDSNNWDTDGDELSDGDEILVWKTDPLNPDSDGDKYPDGTEVKGGYNPNGAGKIFEPPKQ